jgi:biotin-dependent carboxylase-like uncharacterized protein
MQACTLEISWGGFEGRFIKDAVISITGANCDVTLNGQPQAAYTPIHVGQNSVLKIAPPDLGLRNYLAVQGGFEAQTFLNNMSTYLPAKLGGYEGRTLKPGDLVSINKTSAKSKLRSIPENLRPVMGHDWVLNCASWSEFSLLSAKSRAKFSSAHFTASSRANRMGIQLDNNSLELKTQADRMSTPVFPGCIQCPADGRPFVLLADAQTTGGYPVLAQIIRSERHRLGQIRPHDRVHLKIIECGAAITALKYKQEQLNSLTNNISLF